MSIKMQGSENLRCVGVLAVVGIVFLGFLDLAASLTKLVCSQALFIINYHADRSCFMRSWIRQSMPGTQMSILSRKFFVSMT
jgi:hypothetical protein